MEVKLIREIKCNENIKNLFVTPDNKYLIFDQKGSLEVFDFLGNFFQTLKGLSNDNFISNDNFKLRGFSITPDGKQVIILKSYKPYGTLKKIEVLKWDFKTNELEKSEIDLTSVCSDIYGMALSNNGKYLALKAERYMPDSIPDSIVMILIDLLSMTVDSVIDESMKIYETFENLLFSLDDSLIFTSHGDGMGGRPGYIKVWDFLTKKLICRLNHPNIGIYISYPSRMVVHPYDNAICSISIHCVYIWNYLNGELLKTVEIPHPHGLAFTSDGEYIVVNGYKTKDRKIEKSYLFFLDYPDGTFAYRAEIDP